MSVFEVKNSEIHGRGCFTTRKIIAGERFTFPVIVHDRDGLKSIQEMTFPWKGPNLACIVMGPVTFCNASNDPNFVVVAIDKQNFTKTFCAIRNLSAGEEVTLNYTVVEE